MRVLVDTHALLWWLSGARALSDRAREVISANEASVFVSAATAWEVSTKFRIGKLPEASVLASDFEAHVEMHGFLPLSITVAHSRLAGALEGSHKDPFDRMLMAQALLEDMPLVSNEAVFDAYGVRRIW